MPYSFSKIAENGSIESMWNPEVSGDYPTDCAKGREYADEVVSAMRHSHNLALLGWLVRGFGEDEEKRGVEVGFCQRIAEHALSD